MNNKQREEARIAFAVRASLWKHYQRDLDYDDVDMIAKKVAPRIRRYMKRRERRRKGR